MDTLDLIVASAVLRTKAGPTYQSRIYNCARGRWEVDGNQEAAIDLEWGPRYDANSAHSTGSQGSS